MSPEGGESRRRCDAYAAVMPAKEPTRRAPVAKTKAPSRKTWVDKVEKASRPKYDGPRAVEDAAEQELEYPADETDEG